ncbi:Ldh family oxidoreductase [Paracidovorax konjaci]|uniref:Malate/lactate/ureidoglycolate dehydrogenase, LDH2 family n=1 Tax=Paracidovorax konjaci TaxID=32040 RepID=A0A1I1ULZ4_9BURK|nr:Ldh family oxidoreductase [Paracidovorax konjaci]SFD71777.1 Malate/lactate/ureidoglycolate dehydrogenase, LDH2 family [Paracidovorax konjaci]
MTLEARFTADSLRAQTRSLLHAWGMPEEAARTTAALMVDTDLWGVESHGVSMLPQYDALRAAGRLRLDALPRVLRDGPATALLDGGGSLGHAVSAQAMQLAVDKARVSGIALVGVRNSHHFGAAGIYARIAQRQGLLGFVTSSAQGILLVPTRAAEPVLGTNPIAFAAPVPAGSRNPPFVLDMATTTAAANRVKVKALRGEAVPSGWVVDGRGRAVTAPEAARAQVFDAPDGGLTPLGGSTDGGSHKGYGLSLLAQVLGGTLHGGAFAPLHRRSAGPQDPANVGHSFIAIDPGFFGEPGAFEQDLDAILDVLHAARPADPARPVLVPGDPEAAQREDRLRHGIPLPQPLVRHLRALAAAAGVADVLQAAAPQGVPA